MIKSFTEIMKASKKNFKNPLNLVHEKKKKLIIANKFSKIKDLKNKPKPYDNLELLEKKGMSIERSEYYNNYFKAKSNDVWNQGTFFDRM